MAEEPQKRTAMADKDLDDEDEIKKLVESALIANNSLLVAPKSSCSMGSNTNTFCDDGGEPGEHFTGHQVFHQEKTEIGFVGYCKSSGSSSGQKIPSSELTSGRLPLKEGFHSIEAGSDADVVSTRPGIEEDHGRCGGNSEANGAVLESGTDFLPIQTNIEGVYSEINSKIAENMLTLKKMLCRSEVRVQRQRTLP